MIFKRLDLLKDLINCKKQIIFWEKVKNSNFYESIFSDSEIDDFIYYYKDMYKYLMVQLYER